MTNGEKAIEAIFVVITGITIVSVGIWAKIMHDEEWQKKIKDQKNDIHRTRRH